MSEMRELKDWTRSDIENWLYTEAALLDEWRLPEWRQLFTEDASYLVPNMAGNPYAPPAATLYLIADDGHHLTERVKRLGKKTAHAEYPHSTTHRTISNVRLLGIENGELKVSCNFTTNRANSQNGVIDTYFGRQEYKFVQPAEELLAREKRSILSIGALRPHGRLSIIL
jgi:p-cumate 2,3-dioxygenase subunit beta